MRPRSQDYRPDAPGSGSEPTFRSGAVARMAQLPVATLRTWEQRYRAVRPITARSGHRLYSPADLQRVLLLRQLTQRGHAIGSIAGLDSARLQALVDMSPGGIGAAPGRDAVGGGAPLRLVVIGHALATRLQRPAVSRRLARAVRLVAAFETPAQAAAAAPGTAADLLVWYAPALQPVVPVELAAAREGWRARQAAVIYRFAGDDARKAFTDEGVLVAREPSDDEALGAWLASVEAMATAMAAADRSQAADAPREPAEAFSLPPAPRRFDDAALTAIAGLSPTLACECPRHVAELLMQLANFESYSAGCASRNAADASLHLYLQQVAASARALFETALERVARHEGLVLRSA